MLSESDNLRGSSLDLALQSDTFSIDKTGLLPDNFPPVLIISKYDDLLLLMSGGLVLRNEASLLSLLPTAELLSNFNVCELKIPSELNLRTLSDVELFALLFDRGLNNCLLK